MTAVLQGSVLELVRTGPSDEELAERVRAGEPALFEVLMRRHNGRVYRVIRSFLKDEAEVEDAMQQAYVQAYTHLHQFQGQAFIGWLLRIAANEARMSLRKLRPVPVEDTEAVAMSSSAPARPFPTPEEQAHGKQLATLLERAVDTLPEIYRSVFMLREVEALSTEQTAEVLDVSEDVVKTRLHRAKSLLREALLETVGSAADEAFTFPAQRCDRIVAGVFAKLGLR